MIKKSLTGLWRTAAFIVITTAILVSIARFALPEVQRWRPELERSLSKKFKAEVTLGAIDARWRGFGPQFTFSQLSVRARTAQTAPLQKAALQKETTREVLHIGRVHAALDIVRSVLAWRPVMRELSVDGLRAAVELDASGRLQLPGLDIAESDSSVSADYVIDLLLRQNAVAINDSQIQYRRRRGDVIALSMPALLLKNFPGMHQATGDLKVQDGGGAAFILEFSGYPLSEQDQMALFLASDNLDLARLPFSTQDLGMQLQEGRLELKLWSFWRDGAWANGETRFALHDVLLRNAKKQARKLDTLSGHLWFDRHDRQQWRWHGDDFQYAVDGKSWPALALQGQVQRDADGAQDWAFDVSAFTVAQINDWLLFSDAVSPKVQEKLRSFAVQAEVPMLQIDWRLFEDRLSAWAVAARIDDLVYNAGDQVSAQHLSARVLVGSDREGQISGGARITGADTNIVLPGLFREPLSVSDLDLALNWQHTAQALNVMLPHLHWRNADLALWSRASVAIPLGESPGAPDMSLYSYLEGADIAQKSRYLPTGIMSESLTAYLDTAAKSGRVASAWGLVRGPLPAFPFNGAGATEGVFAIHGAIEDAEFAFQPDWPAADQLKADLLIDGADLAINAQQLSWQQLALRDVAVGIKDMLQEVPVLKVQAGGKFDGAKTRQALLQTPLKTTLAGVLDNLDVQGPVAGEFNLDIALDGPQPPQIDGVIQLDDNELNIVPAALTLTGLSGELRFDETGLRSGQVKGQTLDGPVAAEVQVLTEENAGATGLRIAGSAGVGALALWLPHPLEDLVSGRIHYQGELLIPGTSNGADNGGAPVLTLRTDLQDFALALPAPLGKTDREPLFSELTLEMAAEQLALRVNYGEEASAIAIKPAQGPWRAEIMIGDRDYVGDRDGLTVRGRFGQLSAKDWLAPVQTMVDRAQKNAAAQATNAAADGAGALPAVKSGAEPVAVNPDLVSSPRLDLSIAALDAFGLPFAEVETSGNTTASGYRLALNAEKVAGELAFNDGQPIQIQLQHLAHELVPAPALALDAALPPLPALLDLSAKDFPELEFSCQRCRLLSRDIGQLKVQVRVEDDARVFQITAARSNGQRERLLNAKLAGRWQEGAPSAFKGTLHSDSFADLLTDWRIDLGLKDSAGTTELDLSWPGSPFDFSLQTLNGTVKLDWGKGYISTVSDVKARAFSLLSLQSLTRRLSLDFSDLYKDGFFYDGIAGEFHFEKGVAHTDGIFVKGLAADATLMGDADLLRQQLAHRVIVEPKVSASLPILAGWIINPGVGLLTWLANKLFFEDAVSVVTRLEYSITGAMDQPNVQELQRSAKEVPVPEAGLPAAGLDGAGTAVVETEPMPGNEPADKPLMQP